MPINNWHELKTRACWVRLIDDLPDSEKAMILQVIDLTLNKKKFKEMLHQIS